MEEEDHDGGAARSNEEEEYNAIYSKEGAEDLALKSLLVASTKTLAKKAEWYGDDDEDEEDRAADVADLTQCLLNEQGSPDILNFRHFQSLKDRARSQYDAILDDEKAIALEKAIYEMETNRIEFELGALNRIRLQKIAKYPTYVLRKRADRLSTAEYSFAEEYHQLRKQYMQDVFLKSMPDTFEDMDLQDDEDIFAQPNARTFVIFRAARDLHGVNPDRSILANQTYACPYALVEEQVLNGQALLI